MHIIASDNSHQAFWGNVDGVWFLNPSSPTDTVHAAFHSVAILTLGDKPEAGIVRI